MTAAQRKAIARKLAPLLRAGIMCSNICFNMKQNPKIERGVAQSMAEGHMAWDKAVNGLPLWMFKTK